MQPSGALHIGNYFGALLPSIRLFSSYESYLMMADYHALTSVRDAGVLREHSLNILKDYLAAGVDPKTVTIFKQSDIAEHTELVWIFECLVSVSFLQQAHAYKDKVARGLEANAGLFNYPMLMAADILLYDADVVPVGSDQRQHVEYAREAAGKFNRTYGDTFRLPTELIDDNVAVIPGTDGKKMSKSYGNTIPLFGTKDEVHKAVFSIVTDSGSGVPENVYAIHKLLKSEAELVPLYEENVGKYKILKDALFEDMESVLEPMRARRTEISDADVYQVIKEGGAVARDIAREKMKDVREKIGLLQNTL